MPELLPNLEESGGMVTGGGSVPWRREAAKLQVMTISTWVSCASVIKIGTLRLGSLIA